jgi:hypothetical protein
VIFDILTNFEKIQFFLKKICKLWCQKNIFMRKKISLVLTIIIFLLISCNNTDTKKHIGKTITNPETSTKVKFPTINQCKSLLIIAEDRSGSTQDHRKLSEEDYGKLLHQFTKNNYGQIAIRIIGNPPPAEREFFILRIDPLKKYKPVPPKSAKMSVRAAIISHNKKINKENKEIIVKNDNKINNFIKDIIKPKIIQYKPYRNKDITNIKDALEHLQIKTSESIFSSYDNIDVLLISDGKHDASKLKSPLNFEPKNPVNLYLIGWKENKDVFKVKNIEEYDSFDSFIEAYYEKNCK